MLRFSVGSSAMVSAEKFVADLGGLQRRRGGGRDGDRLGQRGRVQLRISAAGLREVDADLLRDRLHAAQVEGGAVVARRQGREAVPAGLAGDRGAAALQRG